MNTRDDDTAGRAPPDDDHTRVQPARNPTETPPRPAASDDDATRLAPLIRQRAAHASDDAATRVNLPPHADDSAGASSWRRVAQLQGDAQVRVGMLLKARFLLVREIGRGGMGVVYLARDERKVEARDRNPYIAVKVLNDDFRRHPDSLIALQRESRRAQSLAHDHIVRVYDFDKDGAIVFMTMEYIEGDDLRGLIRSRLGEGTPLVEAWPLIDGMGRALQRAHAAGIVHSDFKPGNVMVGAGHVAKVFDFGIARAAKLAGAEAGEDHTVFDAATLGALTPAYASLEMLRGGEPAFADDVYAFGCVVYELLSGRHPFAKQSATQAQAQQLRVAPLPTLSRRQNRGLRSSLAFEAGARPAMVSLLEQLRPRSRGERLLPYLLAGGLLLAGAAGMAAWMHVHAQQQKVAGVLERFLPQAPNRFVHEAHARAALWALGEDDRRRLILDRSSTIETFLLARMEHYWQPARGREDYVGAQRILLLRDQWKLFSPRLDARRSAMEQERDRLLNGLDTALTGAIAAGALFEDQPGNVVALLERVRRLAPDSGLLRHAELELRYRHGCADALSAGGIDEARRWLATGRRVFPHSTVLQECARAIDADSITASAVPSTPPPSAVDDAQAQRAAQIAARIESVRAAAAANDVDKVKQQLARIAEANPAHPFLRNEGAERLTDAYLGLARALCREGRWKDASVLVGRGLGEQDAPRLRHALDRYQLAMELEQLGTTPPTPPALQRLRERKAALQAQDAEGFRAFQSDVAKAGRQRPSPAAAMLPKLEPTVAAPPPATAPQDPCRAVAPSGGAATCSDVLGKHGRGPELVVLPKPGRALAMMRREISVADFALFCADTRRCSVSRWTRRSAAVDDVRLALIGDYAAWLSSVSGQTYRLPRDTEWLRAARAGQDSCSATVSNSWGLLEMVGGVAEWVQDGHRVAVRGGARSAGACTSAGAVSASDAASRGIGARLVREVQ
ncbi:MULTISPECIES: bifunctional serine/threonine-protein kinase/formylglycine-generating enzyme family protein [Xanthomonas]|uniref:Bifunctional serine/threonine-protein kinase/formylglycine-generating enzyme family protein n=1 Tax=Xanthomonas campestris pv. papavericola TaxID=487881 RepID=A0AAJ3CFF5_XANCA|nr:MULTISPECIES: bifunctional serine/threonine-protein kinase/formylglycine-generating enzyme family protein [Xanthomonas]MCC5086176.1 protein kinase [Xanthomonas campestris]MCW2039230.1 non-specific serine/threonine protein kinase [Xanthomonas campestris]MEA0736386.1 bifunctional serine/threonine-protein kinase/formylglycine-generating enzyme family protein [Xanthomonas campestris pv. campestris]MEA9787108.1 bifunctional serine/threonine-protein kinase/formylglycine-generating enzyme family pr